jgi:hypothetical protein
MARLPRRLAALLIATLAVSLAPVAAAAAGGTIVTVNQTDLGQTWFEQTLVTGEGAFEVGPSSPPLGHGSYAMRAFTPDDKDTLVTNLYTGQPLGAISGLDYWTYRDASSTSPSFVAPSINIAIFTNATGPGTGFATLVYEPLYAFGNGAIHDDVWQHWDTFAPTQTGFGGGWWTTRQVGGVCAFGCYTDFATLLANAPDATIISVGVNVGRGPATFIGAVDGLSVTAEGVTSTFDFEDLSLDKDGCKDGGWMDFHASDYRNQGDCVSFYASAGRQGPKDSSPAAAAGARGVERAVKAKASKGKAHTETATSSARHSRGTSEPTKDRQTGTTQPTTKGKGH